MTRNATSVLIVDDELPIRRLLRRKLSALDYRVFDADTGEAGIAAVCSARPDIVILDLGLPDIDGIDLLSRIRAVSRVPIVVLSARREEHAKVEALKRGADDYVTKPFGMDELVARLQTALRHGFHEQGQEPVFRSGELMVDLARRRVTLGDRRVKLSPTEFRLLRVLAANAGSVVAHDRLLAALGGLEAGVQIQYLRVYVRLLRRKLEPDPTHPRYIVTEAGHGYSLAKE